MHTPVTRPRMVFEMMSRLTSPKRVLRFVATGLAILSFARIAVLVIESYSQVRNERYEDEDLMRACDNGIASQSADFRALCLKKRSERSAPVLLKALLRACTTCFTDFCESMSSPTKVFMLVLFCLTGIAAPVVKAFAHLFVQSMRSRRWKSVDDLDSGSDDDQVPEVAVLSHNGTSGSRGVMRIAQGFRRRLAHHRADRIAPLATVEELPPSGWDASSEVFYSGDRACMSGRPMPASSTRVSRVLHIG